MKSKLLIAIILACEIAHSQCYDWTKKSTLMGTSRESAVGFSIGTKGYIGTGKDSTGVRNDFWEWDQTTDTWTQKANVGGQARWYAVGFSIGSKGYIGTGHDGGFAYMKDFWEYDPSLNIWTQKTNFAGTGRHWATGFSIGTKGYIGTGYDPSFTPDFWEYDPSTDAWTQKADFAGTPRARSVGFAINVKGYIGTGVDAGGLTKDFWEYNPSTNLWTQKADFGGTPREYAVGFSIGSKGYIGTGNGGPSDFWEYDQASDEWMKKANFGGVGRSNAVGFSVGSNGYIGTGIGGIYWRDLWEYGIPQSMPYEICISTVDSVTSSKNMIVWSKTVSMTIDSFRIYRQIGSVFMRIGSVPYDSTSLFIDTTNGVDPQVSSYMYKISAIDISGNESVLSNANETMHLQVTSPSWMRFHLTWNDYCGFPVSQYYVYRDANNSNSWIRIDSVDWGTNVFVDSFPPTDSSRYRIEAFPIQPCIASIKNPLPDGVTVRSSKSNSSDRLATGINEEYGEPFLVSIFPNPNLGEFTIYNPTFNANDRQELKIYSVMGALVYQSRMRESKTKILLNEVSRGIYHVRISSANGFVNRNIIINNH